MMYQIIRGAICSHMVHSSVLKWISHIPISPDSSAIRTVHFLIQDDLQKSKTITIPVFGGVGAYFSAYRRLENDLIFVRYVSTNLGTY